MFFFVNNLVADMKANECTAFFTLKIKQVMRNFLKISV